MHTSHAQFNMPLIEDKQKVLTELYGDRAAELLERFYGNSKGRKNQKVGFIMKPEQDKTRPLTYNMEIHLHIPEPSRFPTWPQELGKAMVSYHTEAESRWEYKELESSIDTEKNPVGFDDNIDSIRWKDWLLVLIEFKEEPIRAIVEYLAAIYTYIPEEIKPEHIERMRKAHFFTKRKRDPDVGVNGDDGSIYGAQLMNEDWVLDPTTLYDESDESESMNSVNGINRVNGANGVNGHR